MTNEQDRHSIPFIELMAYLLGEAVKRGEIPPGEYITIISADPLPKNEGWTAHAEEEKPEIHEPVSERHEQDGIVTITTDLPGTTPEDIQYALSCGALHLAAHAGNIVYRAEYPAHDAIPETLRTTFKNGVIEHTFIEHSNL